MFGAWRKLPALKFNKLDAESVKEDSLGRMANALSGTLTVNELTVLHGQGRTRDTQVLQVRQRCKAAWIQGGEYLKLEERGGVWEGVCLIFFVHANDLK